MSTLAKVRNNGSLADHNRAIDFPSWSNWIDAMFTPELPKLLMSSFNEGMTLPKVNIRETADAFFVDMAVPGMNKEDFDLRLDNQILSISVTAQTTQEGSEEHYRQREFGYASSKRTFTLPETVQEDRIEAAYKDGILSVHLPKKEEAKQKPPRTISIS